MNQCKPSQPDGKPLVRRQIALASGRARFQKNRGKRVGEIGASLFRKGPGSRILRGTKQAFRKSPPFVSRLGFFPAAGINVRFRRLCELVNLTFAKSMILDAASTENTSP